MTSSKPLNLDDIAARAAGLYEYATGLDDAWQDEADQLTGTDVPALVAEIRRLTAAYNAVSEREHELINERDEARDALTAALEQRAEDLASADNPTRLRWGLNDVLWGDDDSVIVLMSGPDREPYWLELDGDRAGVLGRDLAQHGGNLEAPESDIRPCGHDDYHDPHQWHDRPSVWCPGHSVDADEAEQDGAQTEADRD